MTTPLVDDIVARLRQRGLTIAVAESLTGGLLVAELVRVPGVSEVLYGGVVAYATPLKRDVVGVDAALLAENGPVHPLVARQLAERVRSALAVDGVAARIGMGTTGVAGPDAQDGIPAGTAYIAVAIDGATEVRELHVSGERDHVRRTVVSESLVLLREMIGSSAL